MTLRPPLRGSRCAVAATHWLASSTAVTTLAAGGNAFDAAAAAGFVLQVVEPHSNGLGGDVVILVCPAGTGPVRTVCGQGPMPAAASPEAFAQLGLTSVPAAGLLPATVPGAFGAWIRLLAEYGTLPLPAILDAAIDYATNGYPLLAGAAHTIAAMQPLFADAWPESGRTYLVDGRAPAPGTRMRNPALAETFRRLLRAAESARAAGRESGLAAAHDAFYCGFVAEGIDRFARTEVLDSTGRRHPGLLRGEDLAGWQPGVEDCVRLAWHDIEVFKPGPWSQGPLLLQQLGILAEDDLSALDPGTADYVHLLTETAKLALADREAWYGDPPGVPVEALLDPDYLARRRALIGDRAAWDPAPGRLTAAAGWIPDAEPATPSDDEVPGWMHQLRIGIPTLAARGGPGNTCTVAVADRHGNLCVAVPSGGWLKSSPVIPGLGLSLGTRGQTMWLCPGHPNSLRPGRRPRTTLSPTIARRAGEPFLALGTPGGDQQDQWTLQALLRVAAFGQDLPEAVEVPAFHSDHFSQSFSPRTARPGTVVVERSLGEAVLTELRRRGHALDVVAPGTLGKVCAVGVEPGTGFLRAAAGPRGRQAYAVCG